MTSHPDDQGTIIALLDRMRLQRLPMLLAIKERVDRGEKLEDSDLDFLQNMIEDVRDAAPIIRRHPELQTVTAKMTTLYSEITSAALSNEQKG
jgi:hypothetical protein